MIATETETLLHNHYLVDDYDDFFGSKKKRMARRAKRKAKQKERQKKRELARKLRKEKGGSFLKDVGNVYRDIGGATAIGGIIDSLTIAKDTNKNDNPSADVRVASDYQFSVGSSGEENDKEEDKSSFPTAVYIVGGVIVVGIVTMLVINAQKKKQLRVH